MKPNTNTEAESAPRHSALSVEEAHALWDKHGTQRKAAAAIGIPQSTFHGYLHPARRRERYATDEAFSERHREHVRERYYALSGTEYNRLLLRQRRDKALRRMRQRNERTTVGTL